MTGSQDGLTSDRSSPRFGLGNRAHMSFACLVWSFGLATILASRPCHGARDLLQNQNLTLRQAFQQFTEPLSLDYPGAAEPSMLAQAPAPSVEVTTPRRQLLSTRTGEIVLQSISDTDCDFYGGCLGYVTFSISGSTLRTSPAPDTPSQYRCDLNSGLSYTYSSGCACVPSGCGLATILWHCFTAHVFDTDYQATLSSSGVYGVYSVDPNGQNIRLTLTFSSGSTSSCYGVYQVTRLRRASGESE